MNSRIALRFDLTTLNGPRGKGGGFFVSFRRFPETSASKHSWVSRLMQLEIPVALSRPATLAAGVGPVCVVPVNSHDVIRYRRDPVTAIVTASTRRDHQSN